WIDSHDKEQYIHGCLQAVHGTPWLRAKEAIKLKPAIASAIRPLPPRFGAEIFPSFQNEILNNPRLVKAAVDMELHREVHLDAAPFSLRVRQEREDTFNVETDLRDRARISEAEAHHVIEVALLAIAG